MDEEKRYIPLYAPFLVIYWRGREKERGSEKRDHVQLVGIIQLLPNANAMPMPHFHNLFRGFPFTWSLISSLKYFMNLLRLDSAYRSAMLHRWHRSSSGGGILLFSRDVRDGSGGIP